MAYQITHPHGQTGMTSLPRGESTDHFATKMTLPKVSKGPCALASGFLRVFGNKNSRLPSVKQYLYGYSTFPLISFEIHTSSGGEDEMRLTSHVAVASLA